MIGQLQTPLPTSSYTSNIAMPQLKIDEMNNRKTVTLNVLP